MAGALVTENSEIVTDLHTLGTPEVDVHHRSDAVHLAEPLGEYNRRFRLAVGRGEAVNRCLGFRSRHGTLADRVEDIPALDVITGKSHLRNRSVFLQADNFDASQIGVVRAHGLHQHELTFEPRDRNLLGLRTRGQEFIAHLDALGRALVDEYVIALAEDVLDFRFRTRNPVGAQVGLLRRDYTAAVHPVLYVFGGVNLGIGLDAAPNAYKCQYSHNIAVTQRHCHAPYE